MGFLRFAQSSITRSMQIYGLQPLMRPQGSHSNSSAFHGSPDSSMDKRDRKMGVQSISGCPFNSSPHSLLLGSLLYQKERAACSQIAGPHARQCAHLLVSSTGLHLAPSAARSPGHILAISPCCWIAGPHARQWAQFLVFQYVPSFVSRCCKIARPHARQCAHVLVSMLLVGAEVCSPSAHKNVHCWRIGVLTVGAQECSLWADKCSLSADTSVPCWRTSVFTVSVPSVSCLRTSVSHKSVPRWRISVFSVGA